MYYLYRIIHEFFIEFKLDQHTLYRQKLVKVPKPEFIVLYNGDQDCPDMEVQKLTDAFEDVDVPNALELNVRVYNINKGHNADMLRKSKALRDYSVFISMVKDHRKSGESLEKSFNEVINYSIKNGIMKNFLQTHASEVINMLLTEWNMDDALDVRYEEGIETGKEIGIETGIEIGEKRRQSDKEEYVRRLKSKGMPPSDIADVIDLSIEKISEL
jgi:hypothetical protein